MSENISAEEEILELHRHNRSRIHAIQQQGIQPDTTAFIALKLDALITWLDDHWAGEANLAQDVDAVWALQISELLDAMEQQINRAKLTQGLHLPKPGEGAFK